MPSHPLHDVQRWLMTVMTAPGGAGHGLTLALHRFGFTADDLIRAGGVASPLRRLGVYADGYLQRLYDCLSADYPMLERVMGRDVFGFFARAYLWENPSGSTTLYDLGIGFPDFLARHLPAGTDPDDSVALLPIELARLERARTEALRARGMEQASAAKPAAHLLGLAPDPAMTWAVPPCVRLLALRLDLIPFWQAMEVNDAVPACPGIAPSYVAVSRVRYRVSMYALNGWQYATLCALRDGRPLAAALDAMARTGVTPAQALAEWMLWSSAAQSLGLLANAADLPPS